jgi:molybdopterin-synthase adenylyltransferase
MRLPRVKPEMDPFRTSAGTIRIGQYCYGIAAEMDDPTGSVWALLDAMDGSRNIDEIVARVTELHPGESPDAVRAAIGDLIEAGYVEDFGAPAPPELTARDMERYDRSRSYFRFVDLVPRPSSWQPQVLLRSSRVTIVGLGGVGGHAAMALAACGVGELHCVDMDHVELSNLNRQVLFTENDIGRSKVEAGVARLRQLNSDIKITGERAEIRSVQDLVPLASGCDVLLNAADSPKEIRSWTNLACLETGTPWVDSGYGGPAVVVSTYIPGRGGCRQCLANADLERDRLDLSRWAGNPVIGPSAGIGGYLAAHAVMNILTGSPHLVGGRANVVNLIFPDASYAVESGHRDDCDACARQRVGDAPVVG